MILFENPPPTKNPLSKDQCPSSKRSLKNPLPISNPSSTEMASSKRSGCTSWSGASGWARRCWGCYWWQRCRRGQGDIGVHAKAIFLTRRIPSCDILLLLSPFDVVIDMVYYVSSFMHWLVQRQLETRQRLPQHHLLDSGNPHKPTNQWSMTLQGFVMIIPLFFLLVRPTTS